MDTPLSKSQLCWIILRLIGLSFSVAGIFILFVSLIGPLLLYGSGIGNQLTVAFAVLLQSFVWLLLGFYFLRRGAWVHGLLMYVHEIPQAIPVLKKASVDPHTGLTVEEVESFREWRDGNPAVNSLEIADQVARYRDFQSGRRS